MNMTALVDLLIDAWDHTATAPRETTLVVHLAERRGHLVAAAVVESLTVSDEWQIAA